ncbi:MAG: tRNA threonylcarbamoyladenosine dehydratase [bacterium]|nr:tRNA threonylcarbamoyladenosine dehydratase [bacterium]
MLNQFSRTEILIGQEAIEKLRKSSVAIFGIGGVGGYALEALVRSGVGKIDIIDNDEVCLTNLNRQIIALNSTLGKSKVDVAKERASDINPDIKINAIKTFYSIETKSEFDFEKYDYVIDAIDTVAGKLSLIEECKKANTPIICAMGAGNKLNPTKFQIADISKTTVCPLARVIRQELKKRKINKVKVVFSTEEPIKPQESEEVTHKRQTTGSNAICPAVMGLLIASEVIKDLTK